MRTAVLLVVLVLAAFTMTGCEAIEGIFKAGVWVGVLGVAVVLGIIGFVIAKMRA
jgi:predicted small secreted protein